MGTGASQKSSEIRYDCRTGKVGASASSPSKISKMLLFKCLALDKRVGKHKHYRGTELQKPMGWSQCGNGPPDPTKLPRSWGLSASREESEPLFCSDTSVY
ncbi:MAG: hypothetical protein CL912_15185 [Deltaproteobacteria bacterium]|nr:hypothetical protein [Deltaproteobacteria bacterium]